jgi:Flp pilus assembly protein TadD
MKGLNLFLARVKLGIRPEDPNSWSRLGLAYEECGNWRKAISCYRHAISLTPDDARLWRRVGAAHTAAYRRGYLFGDTRLREGLSADQRRGLEAAVKAFRKAIRLNQAESEAWNNLAFVYGELDRVEDEVAAYREAISVRPDYAEAWHNLTTVYYNRREFEEVARVCGEAVRHIPNDPHTWYDLGFAHQECGRLEDAVNAYTEAWRLRPNFPGPWVNLGISYSKLGRIEDAVRVFREALEDKKHRKKFFLATASLERDEHGLAVLGQLEALYPRLVKKRRT